MLIPIKQIILEGSINQVIEEMAVHINHPTLNKNIINRPDFKENRQILANTLKSSRKVRDNARGKGDNYFANFYDNEGRKMSQIGNSHSNPIEQGNKSDIRLAKDQAKNPRIIASAKQ